MHTFLLSVKHTSESFEYVSHHFVSFLHVLVLRPGLDLRPFWAGEKGVGSRLVRPMSKSRRMELKLSSNIECSMMLSMG